MAATEEQKNIFIAKLKEFSSCLSDSITMDNGEWAIKGFIDVYKNVYTISTDTKVVSKILEIHLYPILKKYAESIGYKIEQPKEQNYYPDFTFINKSDASIKFAVDIKSTYRRFSKTGHTIGFTLGSHGKYFKDRKSGKNIQYPYNSYSGHFCLAIVYTQNEELDDEATADLNKNVTYIVNELGVPTIADNMEREKVKVSDLQSISSVIKELKCYFVEKWKIASDKEGSSNTANIGSISREVDLANESGVFSKLGEEYFDSFWINYGDLADHNGEKIKNIWAFLNFKNEQSKFALVGNGAKRVPPELKQFLPQQIKKISKKTSLTKKKIKHVSYSTSNKITRNQD